MINVFNVTRLGTGDPELSLLMALLGLTCMKIFSHSRDADQVTAGLKDCKLHSAGGAITL